MLRNEGVNNEKKDNCCSSNNLHFINAIIKNSKEINLRKLTKKEGFETGLSSVSFLEVSINWKKKR